MNAPIPVADAHLARGYFESILEHSEDIIFVLDEAGSIVSLSREGEKRLGYTMNELTGAPVRQIVHDGKRFDDLLRSCRERGQVSEPDFCFQRRAGDLEHTDLTLITVPTAGRDSRMVLGIGRDVHCKKGLQEELTRVDRLAELGRSASGIAHDINNPVAVIGEISGWMGVLISDAAGLSEEEKTELSKAVQDIEKQTRRCRAITRQVLNFARDSASEKRSFDLHEVLKNTVAFLQSETVSKNIEITLDLMDALPHLQSDPEQLEQVFINLLSNAIYSIKEKGKNGGEISLRSSTVDRMVQVEIWDNGIGIPKDIHHKIFDLFYTTKPSGKGTGLGLPICRNIVEKLGGEISFESEPGAGTRVLVRLPIFQERV